MRQAWDERALLSGRPQQGQAVWRGTPLPAVQLPQLPLNFAAPANKPGTSGGPQLPQPAMEEPPGTPSAQHQGVPLCHSCLALKHRLCK